VLRTRSVPISLAGSPVTLSGTQVLYCTTNQLGQPDATVATIIHPSAPVGSVRLLSYQTFYDGGLRQVSSLLRAAGRDRAQLDQQPR
jgi:hypothetical protein